MLKSIVIAGAGQAGFQTAASLRQNGFDGAITLVGDEPGLPYQRPPLSKSYLLGKTGRDGLYFRPEQFFADNAITLVADEVVALDRATRRVNLRSGASLGYDHLVLATGARNRPLPLSGAGLKGVYGLKNSRDADAIADALGETESVVVIGAGFIGLEFAAVARSHGAAVHVVELADRVMSRALSAEMSAFFTDAHRGWGVELHLASGIARIVGDAGRVTGVALADGGMIDADLVVYGIGVLPNTRLAEEAGLATGNGIVVDTHLLTNDPAISAIGDCALFPSWHAGAPIRLESVQNAADQGRAVAARLTGKPEPYAAVPWFWSDQGDLKLQTVGIPTGHDATATLGDPATRSFSILVFRQNQFVAAESVNRPVDFMTARKILARSSALTIEEALAPGFDLRGWAMAPTG